MKAIHQGARDGGRFLDIPALGGLAVLLMRIYREITIVHEQLQFVRAPRIFIAQLAGNPRAAFVGFRHVLFLAVLWEFALLLWALGGATPTIPSFLKIPDEQYYFYQLIFYIPMFLLSWLLASGIGYVLSKAFGGSGSYDTILGGFGMTAAVSGYFTLMPDYIQGFLWTTESVSFSEYQELTSHGLPAVLVWGYLLAHSAACLLLYAATIHHSQDLGKLRSVIVAAIAYVVSASFFIIIVR
jgi:hypothetical protein